jgi:hypothetical protein
MNRLWQSLRQQRCMEPLPTHSNSLQGSVCQCGSLPKCVSLRSNLTSAFNAQAVPTSATTQPPPPPHALLAAVFCLPVRPSPAVQLLPCQSAPPAPARTTATLPYQQLKPHGWSDRGEETGTKERTGWVACTTRHVSTWQCGEGCVSEIPAGGWL